MATTDREALDQLVVVTYNLLNGAARAGTDLAWDHRRQAVGRLLQYCAPDLLGVQECFAYQADFLAQTLAGYAWVGLGREADGSGEMAAVFYRRDRFDLVHSGHFWLSENPDVPGSQSWGTHCTRMATWVRLRRCDADLELVFANTHLDHGSETARSGGARLLAQRLPALADGSPLILTGDFNANAMDSDAWTVCTASGLRDAWTTAPAIAGPPETWCDFNPPRFNAGERIDWVLYQGPIRACFCETVTYREQGQYPSDHLPVRAILQLMAR